MLLLALTLCIMGGCERKQKAEPPASLRVVEMQTAQPINTNEAEESGESPAPRAEATALIPTAAEDETPGIEAELLRLINQEREDSDLAPLTQEETLRFAARIRAEEALTSLSHTRPDETPYHTAFSEAGFAYVGKWHGENLAVLVVPEAGYSPEQVAAALFREYADSPGHHSNILSEHFAETGIGVFRQRDGDVIQYGAAQVFAGL
jgi:uncharacterized protein YkwD